MTAHPQRTENGFTLIELLVALAILSFAATLLLSGVVSAGTVARQTSRDNNSDSEIAAAQTILRQRIEGLRPVARLDTRDPTMDMDGADKGFDFYGVPPVGDPAGGVQKYRLTLTGTGDLILFHAPELTDRFDLRGRGVTGWKANRLLAGAASLSLAYFGATHEDPERRWRTVWQGQSHAPELVRIRIGFPAGDARSWPDMVVRPAASIDLACDPETPSGGCGGGA